MKNEPQDEKTSIRNFIILTDSGGPAIAFFDEPRPTDAPKATISLYTEDRPALLDDAQIYMDCRNPGLRYKLGVLWRCYKFLFRRRSMKPPSQS
jgi:hypothetical protein